MQQGKLYAYRIIDRSIGHTYACGTSHVASPSRLSVYSFPARTHAHQLIHRIRTIDAYLGVAVREQVLRPHSVLGFVAANDAFIDPC